MALCDRCINKGNCGAQEFFEEGKLLLLSHCRNFVGEKPREIKTNFQRITSSPEALAEFITGLIGIGKCSWCIDGGNPDACPCDFGKQCLFEGDGCLEWLKQESE